MMLGIIFLYLVIQSMILNNFLYVGTGLFVWVPLIIAVVVIFNLISVALSGEYNYFNPQLIPFIDPKIIQKIHGLLIVICYTLLNGFMKKFSSYLLSFSKEKHKWI